MSFGINIVDTVIKHFASYNEPFYTLLETNETIKYIYADKIDNILYSSLKFREYRVRPVQPVELKFLYNKTNETTPIYFSPEEIEELDIIIDQMSEFIELILDLMVPFYCRAKEYKDHSITLYEEYDNLTEVEELRDELLPLVFIQNKC